MAIIAKRRRGTAIIETDKGILLTSGNGESYSLPGGGARLGESRIIATIREIVEETRLKPYAVEIIFKHLGEIKPTWSGTGYFQDHHTVCLVKATGEASPGARDVKYISYYRPGNDVKISKTTQEIIDKYYQWKLDREQDKDNSAVDDQYR